MRKVTIRVKFRVIVRVGARAKVRVRARGLEFGLTTSLNG